MTAKKFVLHHKCSENVWGLKMLSFIKYLEVIWHDEIQNKKKNTEDVNNDCLKSFSLENATTSIP